MPERPTVADAMLVRPVLAGEYATVGDMRVLLADDHVHCGVVVSSGRLVAIVVGDDIADAPDQARAASYGRLGGRTAAASEDLEQVRERMVANGLRRLAVVDDAGNFLGLLCLKRTGDGFCSAADVGSRAIERAHDAVVLAGGRARRLGGVDKTALTLGDLPILDRVRAGLSRAGRVVVVGPEVSGGPVAALAAGVGEVSAGIVVTVAGDMPFVAGAVPGLLDALVDAPTAEAAVLVSDGRRQYLAAAWRTPALTERLHRLGDPTDRAARDLYVGHVVEVVDDHGWSLDIDTPADLTSARARVAG